MAGKSKKRIDYAGWSVDIFSNDTKIDKLLDAQGWDGFGVYFYLCNMAFGSEGYFYEWCYDLCATTARKMGGGVGAGTVKEAVDYCLQIGLFDKGLFDRWGVLTSRGIQKSFLVVLKNKNRRGTEIYKEYWLLDKNEENYQGVVFVSKNNEKLGENNDSLGVNGNKLGVNGDSLGQKDSKVKCIYNTCAAEPHAQESSAKKEKVSEEQLLKDFEIIYALYPKKRGKTVAFANYKLWVGKGKDVGGKKYKLTNRQIYKAVQKYVRQQEESGQDDYQYWKNFDTLMGRQLLDYVDWEDK